VLFSDGPASGAPMVREALDTLRDEPMPTDERLRWLWLACRASHDIWYARLWRAFGDEFVSLARETGALSVLPHALAMRAGSHAFAGEFTQATALWEEEAAINRAMGIERPSYLGLLIPAWQGREAELQARVEASMSQSVMVGEGQWLTLVEWGRAVLFNGLARYEDALAAAVRAVEDPLELGLASWALPELVEAAVRCERRDLAEEALRRLSAIAVPGAADWGLGADALARALLADGDDAEELYRTALDRFRRAGVDAVLARTHLLYGEWLRRERRRTDARDQLGTAHALLSAMGADAFAERAAHELQATGASARRRTADTSDRLTPQEMQIARLARDGLTNPEIAARLFISPRTVEYHLHKVFAKLSIASRNDLTRALDVDAAQSG
jgi:DNA-binding CsgD family transcriptional regulator